MRILITLQFVVCALVAFTQSVYERELDNDLNFSVGDIQHLNNGDLLMACQANPASYDSSMAILLRTDSLMNPQWAKRFNIFEKDFVSRITPLSDGNYLLGGTARQWVFGTASASCVYKVDPDGNVLWHKVYNVVPSAYDDSILELFERPDGSLMIFIRYGVSNYPTKIIHADASGNVLSARTYYLDSMGVFAESVARDINDTYFMGGTIYHPDTELYSAFVCAVDADFLLWFRRYDFDRDVSCNNIAYTGDGNLAINGSIPDTLYPNTYNSWIVQLGLQGSVLWANEYGQEQAFNEFGTGLTALDDGSLVAVGQANTFAGFDAMAFSVDSSGEVQWGNTYHHYDYQAARAATVLPDGRLVVSGTNLTAAYLLQTDHHGVSACSGSTLNLVHTNLNVAAIPQTPTEETPEMAPTTPEYEVTNLAVNSTEICNGQVQVEDVEYHSPLLEIYPVPARKRATIVCSETVEELRVSDVMGRVRVNTGGVEEKSRMELSLDGWPAGIYIVQVRAKGKLLLSRLIVE